MIIKHAKITPMFELKTKDEKLTLEVGDVVIIKTDGTKHPDTVIGRITFLNEDGISTENNYSIIFWEHIEEINK
jgi:hypothetical protein